MLALVWLDPNQMRAEGLLFLFPDHAEYSKSPIGLPNEQELDNCKAEGDFVRVIEFSQEVPIQ